jgi:hypothetical protein
MTVLIENKSTWTINAAVTGDVGYQHGLPACRVLFLASEEGCQPAFRIVGLPSVPQDLGPNPSAYLGKWVKNPRRGNFIRSKKRGAIEGPTRILLDSSLFLFNVLTLPGISSKSLKFQPVLFSIFTAQDYAESHAFVRLKGANPFSAWYMRTASILFVSWEQPEEH